MQAQCVFCRIAKGELACHKVFEDSEFIAFLDRFPRNPGHTLVVPKSHYRWVWDYPQLGRYYELVGRIANAIRAAMKTDWVVSLVLGQEIPHAHVWLVPRFPGDGHGGAIRLDNVKEISETEMAQIAAKIAARLA